MCFPFPCYSFYQRLENSWSFVFLLIFIAICGQLLYEYFQLQDYILIWSLKLLVNDKFYYIRFLHFVFYRYAIDSVQLNRIWNQEFIEKCVLNESLVKINIINCLKRQLPGKSYLLLYSAIVFIKGQQLYLMILWLILLNKNGFWQIYCKEWPNLLKLNKLLKADYLFCIKFNQIYSFVILI